jgi:signal transduction histidine kinase
MKVGGRLKQMEIFLGLSVLLIITSIIITVYHVRKKREATDLVIHTYSVIQLGNDVYAQLLEIENDRIQYFVKGDTAALGPIRAAKGKLKNDIEQLQALVQMPQAIAIVNDRIVPLINERWNFDKMDFLEKFSDSNGQFPYLTDQKLMNEVQEAFQKLDAIESEALVQRQADLDRIYDFSSVFLLISFGLIGITSVLAWIGLRSREQEIDHLVDSLKEWNLSLEKKVEERTKEISSINEELVSLNADKDNFIGIVSHDLKSPITGIQNLVQLMKTKSRSADEQEYLNLILESCGHMQGLITDILDVNRLDQGLQGLAPKKIWVPDLVMSLKKYYEVIAQEKQIALQVQFPGGEIACHCDESILYQILSNLLSNAIKFSKPGNRVELNISSQSLDVVFEVKDFGPGIELQEIPLLFKKFQKLKARPTQGENSTGLGLFIVDRLVHLLKGRIEVKSVPNQQTSFLVYIPR